MAFEIKKVSGAELWAIESALQKNLEISRFTADIRRANNKITIHDIRLRESKHYCGNHPYACPNVGFERPHKKAKYLEGADWVGFNNMINETLDELGASANVASSLCVIRKGRLRRTEYSGHPQGNGFEWDKDSDCYEDCVGKPVCFTAYPSDTPGIGVWRVK